ncbi:MAG: RHS repeat-associated core domain-containing protein, partial [Candidatus Aminicenantes bacterium]|nr:RHS repeat-associated core domain-containing protein [Candidatus Aminicenantes bacterium]
GREVSYVWGSGGCQSCGADLKLTKIVDSGKKVWEFKYDIMGNAIEMIYPNAGRIAQEYDVANRLIKFTNKRGQNTRYEYDENSRLAKKTTPEGETLFTYDDKDRVTSITAPGYSYEYEYGNCFPNNTLVMEKRTDSGAWTQHIYNRYGLPVRYFDNFLWSKGYSYNFDSGAGTPIGFTPLRVWYGKKGIGTTHETEYYYDSAYRLTKKTTPYLKREQLFSYDTNGILKQMIYRKKPLTVGYFPYVELNLTRDTSGLITSLTGGKQLTVNYNQDLEITNVNHTIPQPFSESYTYDNRGNRLSSLTNSYTYNDLNQLTESTTQTYTYDADGNLIQEKNKLSTEIKKYFYNSENRLIKYEHYATDVSPADKIATYKYDIYGRRIRKTVNGTATNFLWDNDNLAVEMNGNYQAIRRYVTGVGKDDFEGCFECSEAWNPFNIDKTGWYSYVKDQVGTVYKVVSLGNKQIIDNRTYDTFGNLVNQTGSSKGNLGFQSKYYDHESGLYYFYNRYYNPTNGRFINEDPIGFWGGINMFRFERNDPINRIDPYGLKCPFGEPMQQIWAVGPLDAYKAQGLAEEAMWVSMSGILPVTDKSIRNGFNDAFRHCYWSCRMAQEIGKQQALKVGIIHEDCSDSSTIAEEHMDLLNNFVGVELSDWGDCKNDCMWALRMGFLTSINKE